MSKGGSWHLAPLGTVEKEESLLKRKEEKHIEDLLKPSEFC